MLTAQPPLRFVCRVAKGGAAKLAPEGVASMPEHPCPFGTFPCP